MVHRDIKPANLLVQRHAGKSPGPAVVKILDFGLARLNVPDGDVPGDDSIHTPGETVMGTPDYLSPEQARNLHSVDARSDLYSLGCTLYHLLAGDVPFPGGTTLEKLVRHGSDAPRPLRELRPDVPEEVERIAAELMAKNPADRFQSAGELVRALSPYAITEDNNWVAVVPLPVDERLPSSNSTIRLPPIVVSPSYPVIDDPWANLDDSSEMARTTPPDGGVTAEHPRVVEPRRGKAKPPAGRPARRERSWVAPAVAAGLFFLSLAFLIVLVRRLAG